MKNRERERWERVSRVASKELWCEETKEGGRNEGREGTVFCSHLARSVIQNVDTGS